jgi:hypothetical protein
MTKLGSMRLVGHAAQSERRSIYKDMLKNVIRYAINIFNYEITLCCRQKIFIGNLYDVICCTAGSL